MNETSGYAESSSSGRHCEPLKHIAAVSSGSIALRERQSTGRNLKVCKPVRVRPPTTSSEPAGTARQAEEEDSASLIDNPDELSRRCAAPCPDTFGYDGLELPSWPGPVTPVLWVRPEFVDDQRRHTAARGVPGDYDEGHVRLVRRLVDGRRRLGRVLVGRRGARAVSWRGADSSDLKPDVSGGHIVFRRGARPGDTEVGRDRQDTNDDIPLTSTCQRCRTSAATTRFPSRRTRRTT